MVSVDGFLDEIQSEAGANLLGGLGFFCAVKTGKNVVAVFGFDAGSVVGDVDLMVLVSFGVGNDDVGAWVGIFEGVVDDIVKSAVEVGAVALDDSFGGNARIDDDGSLVFLGDER